MSHMHQQNSTGQYYPSVSSTNPATQHNEPPSFQAFPAPPPPVHTTPQQDPIAVSATRRSTNRYRAADDSTIHGPSDHDPELSSVQSQRQRTNTLPAFVPFPSAAPDHRYGPPAGYHAPEVRPIPPPAFVPETSSSFLLLPPPDAIRYPR